MALFILALVLFVVLDIAIRAISKRMTEQKQVKEREAALAVSLNLDFSREAKTLKRVEVSSPKARILCVDDEEVILDSFRKILVLDGYCVDTVEVGQEALGLIQSHHYDFVFTDLKMPQMEGVDVVKSVKHLRPDIDVIVITGYATVESAVECMKFGAMDYIQKPFTEDELLTLTKKSLIKRQDRVKKQLKPKVHISQFAGAEPFASTEFSIPGGTFVSPNHCWVVMEAEGNVRVGIDDFARKLIGHIDGIEFPNLGMAVKAGAPLFSIKQGQRVARFKAPISGQIAKINQALGRAPDRLAVTPYDSNWVCVIDPDNIDADIKNLKIGRSALEFYQEDLERFQKSIKEVAPADPEGTNGSLHVGELERLDDKGWTVLTGKFFER